MPCCEPSHCCLGESAALCPSFLYTVRPRSKPMAFSYELAAQQHLFFFSFDTLHGPPRSDRGGLTGVLERRPCSEEATLGVGGLAAACSRGHRAEKMTGFCLLLEMVGMGENAKGPFGITSRATPGCRGKRECVADVERYGYWMCFGGDACSPLTSRRPGAWMRARRLDVSRRPCAYEYISSRLGLPVSQGQNKRPLGPLDHSLTCRAQRSAPAGALCGHRTAASR